MPVWKRGPIRHVALTTILLATCAHALRAQAPAYPLDANGSNTGALTFSGGLDVPSVYVFRGIVQDRSIVHAHALRKSGGDVGERPP